MQAASLPKSAGFEANQWQVLTTRFMLIDASERHPAYSAPMADLLDPARCTMLLRDIGPIIGSPTLKVTASLLGKRIAFLSTAAALYAMTVFDKGLDLSLRNTVLEYQHDGKWQSRMPLIDLTVTRPHPGERRQWREQIVRQLFAENLALVWTALSASSGVSPKILWENLAVRIYSQYERHMIASAGPDKLARIQEDFDYLLHAPASVFGVKDNPLAQYHFAHTRCDGKLVRVRKTCCFYLRATTPPAYCSVCPLTCKRKAKS
ncbi:MAG TPA: IucA/IucC family C-terminal-domain containing protein [Advenella sp.]|nr:IucA/IucC family C-terminal-domain containing protein [Advenella sp.]